MGEPRYYVLSLAQMGTGFADADEAEVRAAKQVDGDRVARVVVRVVSEIKPKLDPNVHIKRFDEEPAHAQ